jgi:hypothetical protein
MDKTQSRKMTNTVLSRYNEIGYSEQLDIVHTFRYFGWFAVELMLKNSGYSELGYSECLVIMNSF